MIIVIDGPAGSGKSSTAKEIANRLDIQFLDSGALYRTVTLLWLKQNKPDKTRFFENLSTVQLQAEYIDRVFHVQAGGEDLTGEIRSQHVAEHVSEIASDPKARSFVNQFMRSLVKTDTFVADGRDLGTAVFPDADLKFYMDASLSERAKRRFHEMKEADPEITLDQVKQNLKERDEKDSTRKHDPLKKADDAIVIDTTGKTFEEQVTEMISIIQNKLNIN
jgi:CMP/dCMP kinase